MQEEIEHKTVNLAISTTKLSARTLLRGMQFLLRQYDKQLRRATVHEAAWCDRPWRDQCGDPENWHQGL